jgi:hypothetical protein
MARSLVVLFTAALTALTACSTYNPPSLAEAKVVSQAGVRPGLGFVESVGVLPAAREASSSAGGSNAAASDRNLYRLFLQMDNGGSQTVDVDNPTFGPGERVEVTADGRVIRISGRLHD